MGMDLSTWCSESFSKSASRSEKEEKAMIRANTQRKGVLHAAAVVQLFSVRLLLLLLSTLSCEDGFFVVFFPRNGVTGLGTQMSRGRIFARARTGIGVVVYSKIIRTITVHRREEHQRFEYVVFYYA